MKMTNGKKGELDLVLYLAGHRMSGEDSLAKRLVEDSEVRLHILM